MGFIEKLKLLFKARQPAIDIINEVKEVKAGYKTVPFWITLIGSALSLVAALQGMVPASVSLVATTALTFFYNVLRGATKADTTAQKPLIQTTEFWLGVLGQVSAALVALKQGGVNPAWLTTASTAVGIAMAAGQNLAGQQPTAK